MFKFLTLSLMASLKTLFRSLKTLTTTYIKLNKRLGSLLLAINEFSLLGG
jgi:hypothetical protein